MTDNSGRTKWRVHNAKGIESQVPGVCFVLPPPDKDALDAADRLRRQYDRSIALWQKKQLRMRQNMIFATIKVVKGWDLPQVNNVITLQFFSQITSLFFTVHCNWCRTKKCHP